MSEISSRIDNLLAENKEKRADLVRGTGIPASTIRSWIKGATPSAEAAVKVARYFHVSVEWLITGEGDKPEPEFVFTKEELEIIELFRHLNDSDKNAVLTLIHGLESQYSDAKGKNTSFA